MQRLSRNHGIVSAHRRSGTLQVGANHASDAGVLISERQRLERREEHGEALGMASRRALLPTPDHSSNSAMEESPTAACA